MSQFGRTEKTIFTCALLALLVFSYFLYDDSLLFPQGQSGNLEAIGNVQISSNDVRRKNTETFAWLPANTKDKVYQADSIFTGDRSEASITLKDGSVIHVRANSLISLNMKNGQMNLDLKYGDLEAEISKESALVVKSGTEEFKLENDSSKAGAPAKSKIEFKKSHSKNVNLKLVSGQAKLNQAVIKPSEKVSISQTGAIKVVPAQGISYSAHLETNFVRMNPDDPLTFQWNTSLVSPKYQVEISAEDNFSHLTTQQSTAKNAVEIREPMPEGPYFWRIKSYDDEGQVLATSPAYKFNLSYVKPPEIVSPLPQAALSFELPETKGAPLAITTQVQWQAMPQLQQFKWQLSKDAEFTHIFKEQTTNEKALVTPLLENGTYYIRIQGQTAQGLSTAWSEPRSFQIVLTAKKGPERPQAPILVTQKVDFKIPSAQERNPAAVPHPTVTWKPVSNVSQYVVQISPTESFEKTQREEVSATDYTWSQSRPGKYYFRVFAKGAAGLLSPPSQVGTLEILSSNPVLQPLKTVNMVGGTPTEQEVPVVWTEIPYAQKYLVEMSKSNDFSGAAQFEYTTASGKLKVAEPGTYKVRVKALDGDSKPLTEYSNVEELLYSFRSPLVSPVLAEPFNNASIFLQKETEPFVWLEWKKVKNATQYKIEISDRSDFSKILITKTQSENRFLVKQRLPLGKIYWRVRAEIPQEKEISEWTAFREFTIYHQKNEIFVK